MTQQVGTQLLLLLLVLSWSAVCMLRKLSVQHKGMYGARVDQPCCQAELVSLVINLPLLLALNREVSSAHFFLD